jgi:hypothetical protein
MEACVAKDETSEVVLLVRFRDGYRLSIPAICAKAYNSEEVIENLSFALSLNAQCYLLDTCKVEDLVLKIITLKREKESSKLLLVQLRKSILSDT